MLHPSCWLASQSEVVVVDLDVPNQVVNEDVVNEDVVVEAFLRVDHVAPCDGNDVANLRWAQASRCQSRC